MCLLLPPPACSSRECPTTQLTGTSSRAGGTEKRDFFTFLNITGTQEPLIEGSLLEQDGASDLLPTRFRKKV